MRGQVSESEKKSICNAYEFLLLVFVRVHFIYLLPYCLFLFMMSHYTMKCTSSVQRLNIMFRNGVR